MPMKEYKKYKKGKIISAAWKLFYENGYEGTTIEDIIFGVGNFERLLFPITILTAKMRFSARWHMCSMKNMQSSEKCWTRNGTRCAS